MWDTKFINEQRAHYYVILLLLYLLLYLFNIFANYCLISLSPQLFESLFVAACPD